MTVAAVRTTIAGVVAAVTGVLNVQEEQPYGRSPEDAQAARLDEDGKVHFWLVQASSLASGGGAGYLEPRRRVRIDGFLQVDINHPSGQSSYVFAANIQASVEAAISDPLLNVELLERLDVDAEIPEVFLQVGDKGVECHRIGLTAIIIEVT